MSACGWRRPRPASSLRSSRAALENASRFLSSAPWRVRIPLRRAQKRKAPIAGGLSNQWWAMRDVACGFAARFRCGAGAPCVLRWKTLRVSSAPHPCGFESHARRSNKKGPHRWEPNKNKWWAMRDSNPQPCACKAPALTVAPIARAERV